MRRGSTSSLRGSLLLQTDRNLREGVFSRTSAALLAGLFIGVFISTFSNTDSHVTYLLDSVTKTTADSLAEPQSSSAAAALQAPETATSGLSSHTEPSSHVSSSSSSSEQRDFLSVAKPTYTDKVRGTVNLQNCLQDPNKCRFPKAKNPKCRVGAQHFYDTIYQRWLGPLSTNDAEPFQFLEIGFYQGRGFDSFAEFLPRAELHSVEISCLPPGKRKDGKWPWDNFASKNPRYQDLLDAKRLHCGDASDVRFLKETWQREMKRPDAPPLKVVIDDGAHLSQQMAATLFFWFPRLEPGGILVIEDIEPHNEADAFRTGVLPQVLHDLHFCGNPERLWVREQPCFPTIQPLLQSVHCEMHICVFERNAMPAMELSDKDSVPPPHALDATKCLTHSLV